MSYNCSSKCTTRGKVTASLELLTSTILTENVKAMRIRTKSGDTIQVNDKHLISIGCYMAKEIDRLEVFLIDNEKFRELIKTSEMQALLRYRNMFEKAMREGSDEPWILIA